MNCLYYLSFQKLNRNFKKSLCKKNSMFGSTPLSCIYGNNNFTRGGENWIAQGFLVYFAIPYGATFLFILISNMMLIYGFHKTSRPFTIVTNIFIYLSMVDIVLGSTKFFYSFQSFLNIDLPCFVELLQIMVMQFSYFLGICVFGTISFLRYWSIKKPLHSFDTRNILIVLAIEIVICILLVASTVFLFTILEKDPMIIMRLSKSVPFTNLIAILFIVCVNTLSYKNLKSFKNDVDNIQRRKRNSKAITCLLVITAFYVICLLPMLILT